MSFRYIPPKVKPKKLKTLKAMYELERLVKMGLADIRVDSPLAPLPAEGPTPEQFLPFVYPPFRSVEEVIIWERIQTYDRFWQPMVPMFGGPGVPGGTELDFYNAKLFTAIYADGPPHLMPTIAARDLVLRKAVEAAGLRVLAFTYKTPDEVRNRFQQWYQENIGG